MWQALCKASELNLRLTLRSGQVFIWQEEEDVWFGAIDDFPVYLTNNEQSVMIKLENPCKQLDQKQAHHALRGIF